MRIVPCTQGSPEWFAARRGVPTASRFGDIITAKTGKLAAAHRAYIHELIAESVCRLTESPTSRAMEHGVETEAAARAWYEFYHGVTVEEVGFVLDDAGRFGCSPDALVPMHLESRGGILIKDEAAGGLEIKCPTPKVHLRYLDDGVLPDDYKAQVHGSLIVTGFDVWSFVSYCPPFDPLCIRVTPDKFTAKLRGVLDEFWTALESARKRYIPKKEATQ